jgi:RND family efflux transporter MFP subunit
MFVHQLKTGLVVLAALIGLLLVGGGLALGLRANAGPQADPPGSTQAVAAQANPVEQPRDKPPAARSVTVARPVRREWVPYQEYTGRLEPLRAVEVRPAVSGFVLKVLFKAGAQVKKGDVLFELDPRALELAVEKARADLFLAEAKRKQSEADLDHARRLAAAGQQVREEFEKAKWQVDAATAGIEGAKVEVGRAQLELEATKIRAPMSGQVGRPLADAGTLVFRGPDRATLLTTITTIDPIGLTFDMDERSFLLYQQLVCEHKVQGVGSALRMAVAGEEGFPHEGTLESFADHVDPQSGTVRVHGSFANPGQLLLPGMSAQVRIALGPPRMVLAVPQVAIYGNRFVLVVNDGNIAKPRAVRLGPTENGMWIIEDGLRAEDWVVSDVTGIRPGDLVEPRKKDTPKPSAPVRQGAGDIPKKVSH